MARFSLRELYINGDRLPDDPAERDAFLAEQRAELRGLRMVADWCHPCRRTRSQCECSAMNPGHDTMSKREIPPQRHAPTCDWWTDQYPWECTCGVIQTAARASEIDKQQAQP